jgi:hypothetical protein
MMRSLPLRDNLSSHGLPNSNFWEDLALETSAKYLILLVGAAGFEPTTCSTQNCRATRLRYTPKCPGEDVDTRLKRRQQATCQRSKGAPARLHARPNALPQTISEGL